MAARPSSGVSSPGWGRGRRGAWARSGAVRAVRRAGAAGAARAGLRGPPAREEQPLVRARVRGHVQVRARVRAPRQACVRVRLPTRRVAGGPPPPGGTVQQRGGLVAEDGAGDDLLAVQPVADALQVAVDFEFAQGGGDALLAFLAAGGECLDADFGSLRQGLDAYGDPDGGAAEVGVLGEVVADDGEAVGVGMVMWMTPRVGRGPGTSARARARAVLCWVSIGKVLSSLVARPSVGIAVPVGGRRMCGMSSGVSICRATSPKAS